MDTVFVIPYVQTVLVDEELPTLPHEESAIIDEEASRPQLVADPDAVAVSVSQAEESVVTATPSPTLPIPVDTIPRSTADLDYEANIHDKLVQQQKDATCRRNCWVVTSLGVSMVFCLVLVPLVFFGVIIRASKLKATDN